MGTSEDATVIHPMAVVENGARLGAGVRIGPFCHVGPDVTLEDGVELVSHVSISGNTTIGAGTRIHPQATLGGSPQVTKAQPGKATLAVGRNCIIREGVSFHAGTDAGRGATTVGDNGYFMAYCHVAHDCAVGNNVTMVNYSGLAGHAEIGDFVILSGYAAVHQFVRVGHHAFLAGNAGVVGDVIPFGMAVGDRAELRGLNIVGMKRAGIARGEIHLARKAYRTLFSPDRPLGENLELARREFAQSPTACEIVEFIGGRAKRHLTVPPRRPTDEADEDQD